MSDIWEAATQDMIAESLLTAPIVGSSREGSLAESAEPQQSQEEHLADLSTDRDDWRAENQQTDPFVAREAARRNANAEQQEQRQQQEAQPLTPEAIQESISALDTIVRENNLNDPAAAKDLASGLCEAFGSDVYKSGVNVEALGNTMAKVAFSALTILESTKGNPGQLLAPIPPESARAFAYDFLKAFGVDPRAAQVNEQLLAETVLGGALNFMESYNRFGGKVTDLAQINQPEAAEWFLGNFLQAFGIEAPVDRAAALKLADAGGKYLLSFIGKLGQIQTRAPQRASRKGGASRQGNRFRTNADIFSPDVLERLELEKATGRHTNEFAPKTRRGSSSQFQSNHDIFNDETLADYQRL